MTNIGIITPMNMKDRFQRWFKPRFAIMYPFGIIVLIFCSSDEHSLKLGIGYIIAGLLIRLWSNGYAIKNDKLTTSGPYSFVRNPLYLGTFLIVLGFVITLKMSWAGLAFMIALAFVYYRTVQGEQQDLLAKFGENYKDYSSKVPAMVPCLIPYTRGEKWPFSLDRLIFSKEHKSIVWITVLLIFFHLKTRLFIEHKALTPRSWLLIILAVTLIAADILFEVNKKSAKK